MTDFEDMYSKFLLDEETREQLNKFANQQSSFEACTYPFSIETLVNGKKVENNNKEVVVNNAELV